MADAAESHSDLFSAPAAAHAPVQAQAPAPIVAAPPAPPYTTLSPDLKAKVVALVDKHFPTTSAGGHDAFQPYRKFLIEFADLLK